MSIASALQPDQLDNAQLSEAFFVERRVALSAAKRTHDYVILFYRGDETHEDRFTGTPGERVDHMQHEVIERDGEPVAPLGIDLDVDSWASGSYDWDTRKWQVCGNDGALKQQLSTRPHPVS